MLEQFRFGVCIFCVNRLKAGGYTFVKFETTKVHIPANTHRIQKRPYVLSAYQARNSKELAMLTRTNRLWTIVVIAVLVVTGAKLGNAAAQKAAIPKPQNKLAIAENEVKQLLPLMDTDKRGMVSRQEFMRFMEAEFERLDKNKQGELNVKELTQSTLTANRLAGK